MIRRLVTGWLTTACVLAAAGAAHAAWLPPGQLDAVPGVDFHDEPPSIVVDGQGNATAAWVEIDDTTDDGQVMVSRRPAGGSWSAAAPVAGPNAPDAAALGVAPDGTLLLVWTDDNPAIGGQRHLEAARAPANGSFTGLPSPDSSEFGVRSPVIRFDSSGNALVAFVQSDGNSNPVLRVARLGAGAAAWDPTALISTGLPLETYRGVSLAISPSGDASVTWGHATTAPGTPTRILGAGRPAGTGIWGAVRTLDPQVPATNSGETSVTYSGSTATAVWALASAVRRTSWTGAAVPVAATLTNVATGVAGFGTAAATSSDGGVFATWTDRPAAGGTVFTARGLRLAGASSAGQALNDAGSSAAAPALVADGSGRVTSAWMQTGTAGGTVAMRAAQTSGTFAFPASDVVDPAVGSNGAVNCSNQAVAPCASPRLATTPAGDVIATWSTGSEVRWSVLDLTPPAVAEFSAPTESAPGSDLTFSMTTADDWVTPTVSWDFGDGNQASGSPVTHRFAAAGTYTVTGTATDAAGNKATRTTVVTVTATPSQEPPPAPLPPPVLGESINVFIIKPPVRIKLPRTRTFRPLTASANLPNGTVIDVRKGRVRVVIANGEGGFDAAEFYGGIFEVNQPKRLRGLANIFLNGGGFKGCPKAPAPPRLTAAAKRKRLSPTRSVRKLWGEGSGKFRTVGRFSSATLRGTKWLTDDRCNGTLTRVTKGAVNVRDFVKRKTVVVRAGKRYFAAAPKRRSG